MLNSKFLFTLIGLLIAVFTVCQTNFAKNTIEGFWGIGSRRWKVFPGVKNSKGQVTAAGGNFLGPLRDDRFVKRPQMQGLMSPRFANVDFGANIRYNMPSHQNQAVPCKPLDFGNMAKENFTPKDRHPRGCGSGTCGQGCAPSCGKGGMPVDYSPGNPSMPGSYAAGNFNKVLDQTYNESSYPEATDSLPVGTMTTVNAEGDVTQPVVYQNFVFANMRSRLRGLGDPIRGDIPIVPCEGNWFSVHPNVNLDLHEGAMNVMGGVTNATNRSLATLINDASGGADTTIGGVNLANVNMTPEYTGSYGAALKDVQISGMP